MGSQVHGTSRRVLALVVAAASAAAAVLLLSDPALAQVTTIETIPPAVDENGLTAGERVDQVVFYLRILAVVLLAATAGFWWHTRPSRRLAATGSDPVAEEVPEEAPVVEVEAVAHDPELEALLSLHLGVDAAPAAREEAGLVAGSG